MKVTLTGSLGRIGRPLTQELIEKGYTVTVISSSSTRSQEIEALGAIPAIGRLQDVDFLASTFQGADVVYTMVPPANYFDQHLDLLGYFKKLGHTFAQAIQQAQIKHVVNLSSIGAHLANGNGILEGLYHVEQILNNLPEEVGITHMRPTEIYYNLFQFVDLIKHQGIIGSNLGENDFNAWVSPADIASATAEEIMKVSRERKARYITSEELTYKEVASILGSAIGKPDLKWVMITDEQLLEGLKTVGMQPTIAEGMMAMYAAIRSGLLYEDYHLHKPTVFGKVKMKDFATEFAEVYHQK
ncbi:NAD-dependent dehydratase [marine bacterium AO1-C]|nr:NAD-dependent dehydratase [marine bacterium AO1-C]